MRKLLLSLLLFTSFVSFSAPTPPVNGGTGISNSNTNTLTLHAPMVFPNDLNFQYIYDHSPDYPAAYFLLADDINSEFTVARHDGGYALGVSDSGIYIEYPSGIAQDTEYGYFRVENTFDDFSTYFQVANQIRGAAPFPFMTTSEINSIDLSHTPLHGWNHQGLGAYDTDQECLKLYTGDGWQCDLTPEHVLAGANTTVTNNGNGTITISSSGGGDAPAPAYAAYSVVVNSAPRPATAAFVAVPVSSGFIDEQDACFTSSIVSIGGVNTPISVNTCLQTQFYQVDQSVAVRSVGTPYREYIYAIAIKRANGSIETTNYRSPATQDNDVADVHVASMHGIVELAPGDGVFTQVMAASDANAPTVYINSKIANMAGSIPDTDGLPQGLNKLYLSQDGGATYQYLTGSSVLNDVPVFDSIGGHLIDSGLAKTSLLTTSSVAGGDLTGTYPNPTISSNAVSYDKFQQIAASSLVGNPTGSTANGQGITLGSTLSFSGTTLQTAALSGDVTTSANSFATTIANGAVTNAKIANSTIDLTTKVTGTLPFANGALGFSTATTGDLFYASGTNTPGKLADVATGRVLVSGGVGASPSYSATPTVSTLTVNNGGSALSGITPAFSFTTALSAGDYLNWGSGGRNQGVISGGNLFLSNNLDYNGSNYIYWSSAPGTSIEIGQGSINLRYAASGTGGTTATMVTGLSMATGGDITVPVGNVLLSAAGKTVSVKTGTNACAGSGAVMVAGVVTVNTTCAISGSIVFLMKTANGGTTTTGMPVISISAGTSFTATSDTTDTSTWSWYILHTT